MKKRTLGSTTLRPIREYNYLEMASACINDMFEGLSDDANEASAGHSRANKPDGETPAYVCIHLSIDHFLSDLFQLRSHIISKTKKENGWEIPSVKFIDVGCGVGQKVYLAARHLGFDAEGIEMRKEHVKIANEALEKFCRKTRRYGEVAPTKVFEGNAITFEKYSDYDIIYFYCPSHEPATEAKIEWAIAKGAKVGAYVIGYGDISVFGGHRRNCNESALLAQLGWRKATSQTATASGSASGRPRRRNLKR